MKHYRKLEILLLKPSASNHSICLIYKNNTLNQKGLRRSALQARVLCQRPGSSRVLHSPVQLFAALLSSGQRSQMVLRVFLGSAGSTPPAWGRGSQPQVLRWPQGPLFLISLLPHVFIFSDYHITAASFLSTSSITTILGWSTITCSSGSIWTFCRILAVIFHHLWRWNWAQSFQSKLSKDVCGRHLVVMHHGCFTYEHHTACGCYVLGCLGGFFAQHASYVVW